MCLELAEEQALSYNSNSEDMESEAPGAHNIWSFSVKYLGSTPLEQARSDKATAQAIKSIFALVCIVIYCGISFTHVDIYLKSR